MVFIYISGFVGSSNFHATFSISYHSFLTGWVFSSSSEMHQERNMLQKFTHSYSYKRVENVRVRVEEAGVGRPLI